jgi:hypothetical protein
MNFTSTVNGGTPAYTYQWFVNGTATGTNSPTFLFHPTSTGTYLIYLRVTDATHNTAQSQTATIKVVAPSPVGGYSVPLNRPTTYYLAIYVGIVTLFGAALSLRKRKRK